MYVKRLFRILPSFQEEFIASFFYPVTKQISWKLFQKYSFPIVLPFLLKLSADDEKKEERTKEFLDEYRAAVTVIQNRVFAVLWTYGIILLQ